MKNKIKIIVAVAVVLFSALFFLNIGKANSDSKIESGHWYQRTYIYDESDPFELKSIDTIFIIDRKNGYVKYAKKDWFKGDTIKNWTSGTEKYVLRNTVLIK